ncbi:hypothetical protein J5X07_09585 [Actinomyces bowdenii]|uniref:DNA-directed RNA polymerase subunit beta n=1 Tax=Actinomyces bowdenii TaxID=131109 RepID=A0A3P1VAV5_9ACTO|nr:hypothetical protein [Actinomyces bowdenii]MBO3725271.1 hypothetical protein [Actinomyces bowdenii]RRD30878.1 hypothetical protein EII10_01940 [Actinomyces bowdenii]
MARQFHRPARLDPEAAEQIEGSTDTAVSSELAHRAAQALIGGFPVDGEEDLITRAGVTAAVASTGVDDVAELWADSPATTLPGTLWRLFLVREWIRRDPGLVARRYSTTVDLTGADAAAGARLEAALVQARPAPAPEELRERLDAVLAGRIEGSVTALAPLLRLTSGFLRALAAGSNPVWIEDDADELADRVTRRDSALLATADELAEAARRAAAGLLD